MNSKGRYAFYMDTEALYAARRAQLKRLIRDQFGDVKRRFADAIRRKDTYVNRLLLPPDNPHSRNLAENLAREIEDILGMPRGWLDSADSPDLNWRFKTIASEEAPAFIDASRFIGRPAEWVRVPRQYFYYDGAAGRIRFAEDRAGIPHTLPVESVKDRNPKALVSYTVMDDRMAPRLTHGSQVLVDTDDTNLADSGVFAIESGSTVSLARITPRVTGGHLFSLDNPVYPQEIIAGTELAKIKVLGRVILATTRTI